MTVELADERAELKAMLEQLRAGPYRYFYTETEPPAYARSLAISALEIVQRELGIAGLTVKFFRLHHGPRWPYPVGFAFATDRDVRGAFQYSRPDVVWVKGDYHGGAPLVATVCHEARHAERHHAGIAFATTEDAEADADAFAERMAPAVLCEILEHREKEQAA